MPRPARYSPVASEGGGNPSLAVNASGVVSIAWELHDQSSGARSIRAARSVDGGKTWSAPVTAMSFDAWTDLRDVNCGVGPGGKFLVDVSAGWTIAFTKER